MTFKATRTKLQEILARKETMRRMRLSRTVELWISALAYSKGGALSKRDREANASFPGSSSANDKTKNARKLALNNDYRLNTIPPSTMVMFDIAIIAIRGTANY